jgi:hypothetical protein
MSEGMLAGNFRGILDPTYAMENKNMKAGDISTVMLSLI